MRNLLSMDTIQIEITNACIHACSNCTRFCGHHKKPYMMGYEQFKEAIDSLVEFPNMTGFMGGEPLLHPDFEKFCEYAVSKIPKERLGLWSCFPKGYEKYREVICHTFGNVFLNDHTMDIYHAPILVAVQELVKKREDMFLIVDHCWMQQSWSAAINPREAFFCEIAAAMSILFDGLKGWNVEPGWWKRTPKDFTAQIEEYCPKCGIAVNFMRRNSREEIDDMSQGNYELLKDKSRKIKTGKYKISDMRITEPEQNPKMFGYKDTLYRDKIAARYGIILGLNQKQFLSPYLKETKESYGRDKSLFEEYKEKVCV